MGLFWAALAELSAAQVEALLRKVWKKALQLLSLVEAHYSSSGSGISSGKSSKSGGGGSTGSGSRSGGTTFGALSSSSVVSGISGVSGVSGAGGRGSHEASTAAASGSASGSGISGNEVFCMKLSRLPAPFRVFQPTAVALLLPDDGELLVLADQCALSVPHYSTLEIMHRQLQKLVSQKFQLIFVQFHSII